MNPYTYPHIKHQRHVSQDQQANLNLQRLDISQSKHASWHPSALPQYPHNMNIHPHGSVGVGAGSSTSPHTINFNNPYSPSAVMNHGPSQNTSDPLAAMTSAMHVAHPFVHIPMQQHEHTSSDILMRTASDDEEEMRVTGLIRDPSVDSRAFRSRGVSRDYPRDSENDSLVSRRTRTHGEASTVREQSIPGSSPAAATDALVSIPMPMIDVRVVDATSTSTGDLGYDVIHLHDIAFGEQEVIRRLTVYNLSHQRGCFIRLAPDPELSEVFSRVVFMRDNENVVAAEMELEGEMIRDVEEGGSGASQHPAKGELRAAKHHYRRGSTESAVSSTGSVLSSNEEGRNPEQLLWDDFEENLLFNEVNTVDRIFLQPNSQEVIHVAFAPKLHSQRPEGSSGVFPIHGHIKVIQETSTNQELDGKESPRKAQGYGGADHRLSRRPTVKSDTLVRESSDMDSNTLSIGDSDMIPLDNVIYIKVEGRIAESRIRAEVSQLSFDQCLLGTENVKEFTVWNLSEITTDFRIKLPFNALSIFREHRSDVPGAAQGPTRTELEFSDYETDLKIGDGLSHKLALAPFGHRRIRVMFQPFHLYDFETFFDVENVRDPSQVSTVKLVLSSCSEPPVDGFELSCGSEIHFGDCYARNYVSKKIKIRNLLAEKTDLFLGSDHPDIVFFEVEEEMFARSDSINQHDTALDISTLNSEAAMGGKRTTDKGETALTNAGSAQAGTVGHNAGNVLVSSAVGSSNSAGTGVGSSGVQTGALDTSGNVGSADGTNSGSASHVSTANPSIVSSTSKAGFSGSAQTKAISDVSKDVKPASSESAQAGSSLQQSYAETARKFDKKNCIDEITLNPNQERWIRVWYFPTPRRRDLVARISDHPSGNPAYHVDDLSSAVGGIDNEATAHRLESLNFRLSFKSTKQQRPKYVTCKSRTCESYVKVVPENVALGDCNVQSQRTFVVQLMNCSDLTALLGVEYSSQSIFSAAKDIVIAPWQTYDLSFNFIPRKVNPEYKKEINLVNWRNRSNDTIFLVGANVVDQNRAAIHSLYYKLLAPLPTNELDFGATAEGHPAIRTFKLKNITPSVLKLRFDTPSYVLLFFPRKPSIGDVQGVAHGHVSSVATSTGAPSGLSRVITSSMVDKKVGGIPYGSSNLEYVENRAHGDFRATIETLTKNVSAMGASPTFFSDAEDERAYIDSALRPARVLSQAIKNGLLYRSQDITLSGNEEVICFVSFNPTGNQRKEALSNPSQGSSMRHKYRPLEVRMRIYLEEYDLNILKSYRLRQSKSASVISSGVAAPGANSTSALSSASTSATRDGSSSAPSGVSGNDVAPERINQDIIKPREVLLVGRSCKTELDLAQRVLNFGPLYVGEQRSKYLVFHNKSEAPLLYRIKKSGSIASIDLRIEVSRYGVIRPYSSKEVPFIFAPSMTGVYNETITILNLIDRKDVQGVTIKGVVYRRSHFNLQALDSCDFGTCFAGVRSEHTLRIRLDNVSEKTRRIVLQMLQLDHMYDSVDLDVLFQEENVVKQSNPEDEMIIAQKAELESLEGKLKGYLKKGKEDKAKKTAEQIEQIKTILSALETKEPANDDGPEELAEDASAAGRNDGVGLGNVAGETLPKVSRNSVSVSIKSGESRTFLVSVLPKLSSVYCDLEECALKFSIVGYEAKNKDTTKRIDCQCLADFSAQHLPDVLHENSGPEHGIDSMKLGDIASPHIRSLGASRKQSTEVSAGLEEKGAVGLVSRLSKLRNLSDQALFRTTTSQKLLEISTHTLDVKELKVGELRIMSVVIRNISSRIIRFQAMLDNDDFSELWRVSGAAPAKGPPSVIASGGVRSSPLPGIDLACKPDSGRLLAGMATVIEVHMVFRAEGILERTFHISAFYDERANSTQNLLQSKVDDLLPPEQQIPIGSITVFGKGVSHPLIEFPSIPDISSVWDLGIGRVDPSRPYALEKRFPVSSMCNTPLRLTIKSNLASQVYVFEDKDASRVAEDVLLNPFDTKHLELCIAPRIVEKELKDGSCRELIGGLQFLLSRKALNAENDMEKEGFESIQDRRLKFRATVGMSIISLASPSTMDLGVTMSLRAVLRNSFRIINRSTGLSAIFKLIPSSKRVRLSETDGVLEPSIAGEKSQKDIRFTVSADHYGLFEEVIEVQNLYSPSNSLSLQLRFYADCFEIRTDLPKDSETMWELLDPVTVYVCLSDAPGEYLRCVSSDLGSRAVTLNAADTFLPQEDSFRVFSDLPLVVSDMVRGLEPENPAVDETVTDELFDSTDISNTTRPKEGGSLGMSMRKVGDHIRCGGRIRQAKIQVKGAFKVSDIIPTEICGRFVDSIDSSSTVFRQGIVALVSDSRSRREQQYAVAQESSLTDFSYNPRWISKAFAVRLKFVHSLLQVSVLGASLVMNGKYDAAQGKDVENECDPDAITLSESTDSNSIYLGGVGYASGWREIEILTRVKNTSDALIEFSLGDLPTCWCLADSVDTTLGPFEYQDVRMILKPACIQKVSEERLFMFDIPIVNHMNPYGGSVLKIGGALTPPRFGFDRVERRPRYPQRQVPLNEKGEENMEDGEQLRLSESEIFELTVPALSIPPKSGPNDATEEWIVVKNTSDQTVSFLSSVVPGETPFSELFDISLLDHLSGAELVDFTLSPGETLSVRVRVSLSSKSGDSAFVREALSISAPPSARVSAKASTTLASVGTEQPPGNSLTLKGPLAGSSSPSASQSGGDDSDKLVKRASMSQANTGLHMRRNLGRSGSVSPGEDDDQDGTKGLATIHKKIFVEDALKKTDTGFQGFIAQVRFDCQVEGGLQEPSRCVNLIGKVIKGGSLSVSSRVLNLKSVFLERTISSSSLFAKFFSRDRESAGDVADVVGKDELKPTLSSDSGALGTSASDDGERSPASTSMDMESSASNRESRTGESRRIRALEESFVLESRWKASAVEFKTELVGAKDVISVEPSHGFLEPGKPQTIVVRIAEDNFSRANQRVTASLFIHEEGDFYPPVLVSIQADLSFFKDEESMDHDESKIDEDLDRSPAASTLTETRRSPKLSSESERPSAESHDPRLAVLDVDSGDTLETKTSIPSPPSLSSPVPSCGALGLADNAVSQQNSDLRPPEATVSRSGIEKPDASPISNDGSSGLQHVPFEPITPLDISPPQIILKGCSKLSKEANRYEIDVGQITVGNETVNWALKLESSRSNVPIEYKVHLSTLLDHADDHVESERGAVSSSTTSSASAGASHPSRPRWISLNRNGGIIDSSKEDHTLLIQFSPLQVNVYSAYIIIENRGDNEDLKIIRVSLEVVADGSNIKDVSTRYFTIAYDGQESGKRSIDYGVVMANHLYRHRSFVIMNHASVPMEFLFRHNLPSSAQSELHFSSTNATLKKINSLSIAPKQKRRVFLYYSPRLEQEDNGGSDSSTGNSKDFSSANVIGTASTSAAIESGPFFSSGCSVRNFGVYVKCRLVKNYQEIIAVRCECWPARMGVSANSFRFSLMRNAEIDKAMAAAKASNSQAALVSKDDTAFLLDFKDGPKSVLGLPHVTSLNQPSVDLANFMISEGITNTAVVIATMNVLENVVAPTRASLAIRNLSMSELTFEVRNDSLYFELELPQDSTIEAGAKEKSLVIRPNLAKIREHWSYLKKEQYVEEHFTVYNREVPREFFWIRLYMSFGDAIEFQSYVNRRSPAFAALENIVAHFLPKFSLFWKQYRRPRIAGSGADSIAIALASTTGDDESVEQMLANIARRRKAAEQDLDAEANNLWLERLDNVAKTQEYKDLLFEMHYVTDELVFFALRDASECVIELATVLFSVAFKNSVFASFMRAPGEPITDQTRVPRVLAPFIGQLRHFLSFFPEHTKPFRILRGLQARLDQKAHQFPLAPSGGPGASATSNSSAASGSRSVVGGGPSSVASSVAGQSGESK